MRDRTLRPPLPSRPSWWLEEARAHGGVDVSPPLAGPIDVDVAIVGGGYTGLWTALELRERDPSLSVALLEAREIGDGPSGRNGGFLHGYWSSLPTLRTCSGTGPHCSSLTLRPASSLQCARSVNAAARTSGCERAACSGSRPAQSEDAGVERAIEAAPSSESRRRRCCSTRPMCGAGATRRASAAASSSATARRSSRRGSCCALRRAAIASGVAGATSAPR